MRVSRASLGRRCASEALGTCFLLIAVIGSGIMADRLSSDDGVSLLANSVATGGALVALILTFSGISGAHFNPVVSVADAVEGGTPWRDVSAYVAAQLAGAVAGAAVANAMFGLAPFTLSTHGRGETHLLLGELVATFGLLATIAGCSRSRPNTTPFAVAAYITGAYWFTSSTSFANPAVTVARALTDTFAGIRVNDVPAFVLAQLVGALLAITLFRWLVPAGKPA